MGASGQPEIEKEMDLYNNKIGRIIGSRNKSKSDNSLADIVQQDVRNGRMRRIVKEKLVKTNSDGER
ncbi:DUF6973 domain-containing protein [Caloranaerobacter ferrireducens]|uniref:DUF6973 domain-containing protein n=1 Tax=Caloranaerobacter ferrireducens TaxID=1323370 RepID=UPI0009F56EFF